MNITLYYQWGKNFAEKLDLSAYKNILDIGCRKGLAPMPALDSIASICYH